MVLVGHLLALRTLLGRRRGMRRRFFDCRPVVDGVSVLKVRPLPASPSVRPSVRPSILPYIRLSIRPSIGRVSDNLKLSIF